MKSRLHHPAKPDTMKCVRFRDGKIERVSNDEAHNHVRSKRGSYASKIDWKKQKAEKKAA